MNKKVNITKSAGGIVLNKNNKMIVVNQNYDSWSLPKGHIDPGETALQAAKREIYEETGVTQLSFIDKLGKYERYKIGLDGKDDLSELKQIEIFLFRTNQLELKPIDPMNPEAKWVSYEEVLSILTHQADKDFIQSVHNVLY